MGIKYGVDESFFDTWSHSMAYVLGFWYADGSLEDSPYIRGKYVRVTSTDQAIIEDIRSALSSEHRIVKESREAPRQHRYLLRIGSLKLFEGLVGRGVTTRKSLTMSMPRVPSEFLGAFVRGYFDGDGCVHIERRKTAKGIIGVRRLSVIFTSGSREFLVQLEGRMRKDFELGRRKVTDSDRSYQLRYSTEDSVRLFKVMYGSGREPLLRRKLATFSEYFSLRPTRIDNKVERILKHAAH